MSKPYKAYRFRAKDPVIGELRRIALSKYGDLKLNYTTFGAIERAGGPGASTINNWLYGKTLRPQNASIEAAGRAMGMKRVWVKDTKKNNDK